ncbi:MAG: glycoside hydrolase family 2 protein, partial [Bacteroidales bacterium]|nr:glycoside hydrolase family 2 protein [Bacteroidales bacterium]
HGTQKLYTVECLIRSVNQIQDQRIIRLGLRTISLKSFSENGNNAFIFNVNGKNIYIRGSNLIPAEYFPSDITPEKYDEIIHNALSVNMNMLRVWGGGIYEADYFYDLCDKHGIMVWQDFMFACSMYPSGEAFLLNIRNEIRYHVRRLRNHPSLVLWCGNNEIQEGYHNWGWKDAPEFDSKAAWQSYQRIFHKMIPEILIQEDPTRPYWPSSPSPGTEDAPDLKRGDYHYWDLVKNIQPYTVYKDNVGRFMSEYGFKAYPEIRSLLLFLDKKDLDIRSEAMEAHQGWETGADLVEKNLRWFYPEVSGIELFTYVSQLLQADAIEFAVENQRIAKPYCMGTMYWQLNDCWPAASWSGIDYYGRWKALHYRLKTAFRDIMFNANTDNGCLKIHIVSDLPELKTVQLQFCILSFDGKVIAEENVIHDLSPDSSQLVYQQDIREFLSEDEMKSSVLIMNAFNGNHLLSHKKYFFVKPRDLALKDPIISLHIEKKFNKFFIFLKTLKLAKSIYLVHTKTDGFFSDNYFDLLPGEDKIVVFVPRDNCDCKLEDFGYLSLWNCF